MYSAAGRYSQHFTFPTFCYVTAIFQNGNKNVFFFKFYTQHPLMTMFKKNVIVTNLLKPEKSHVHKYSQPLPQVHCVATDHPRDVSAA